MESDSEEQHQSFSTPVSKHSQSEAPSPQLRKSIQRNLRTELQRTLLIKLQEVQGENAIEEELKKRTIDRQIRSILEAPKRHRSLFETQLVTAYLQKKCKYFKDLRGTIEQSMIVQLCAELTIEHFQNNQIVFAFGDIGRKMFIILSGEVVIFVPKNLELQTQAEEENKNSDIKEGTVLILRDENGEQIMDATLEELAASLLPEFKQVNSLSINATFGEVALENRIPRTATVVASKPDTALAVLHYDSFQKILHSHQLSITKEKVRIFKQMALFRDWPSQTLQIVYNISTTIELPVDSYVYKEGEESTHLYFVVEGVVELSIANPSKPKQEKSIHDPLHPRRNNQAEIHTSFIPYHTVVLDQHFGELEIFESNILQQLSGANSTAADSQAIAPSSTNILPLRHSRAYCKTRCRLMRIKIIQLVQIIRFDQEKVNTILKSQRIYQTRLIQKALRVHSAQRNGVVHDPVATLLPSEVQQKQGKQQTEHIIMLQKNEELQYHVRLADIMRKYQESKHIQAEPDEEVVRKLSKEYQSMQNLIEKRFSYAIPFREDPLTNPYAGLGKNFQRDEVKKARMRENLNRKLSVKPMRRPDAAASTDKISLLQPPENDYKYRITVQKMVRQQQLAAGLEPRSERLGTMDYGILQAFSLKERTQSPARANSFQKESIKQFLRSKISQYTLLKHDSTPKVESVRNSHHSLRIINRSQMQQRSPDTSSPMTSFQKYRQNKDLSSQSLSRLGIYQLHTPITSPQSIRNILEKKVAAGLQSRASSQLDGDRLSRQSSQKALEMRRSQKSQFQMAEAYTASQLNSSAISMLNLDLRPTTTTLKQQQWPEDVSSSTNQK